MQRSNSGDPQDVELGLDEIHIEIEGQHRSRYGGITAFTRTKEHLVIALEDAAAAELDIEGTIEIHLNREHAQLNAALSLVEKMARDDGISFESIE